MLKLDLQLFENSLKEAGSIFEEWRKAREKEDTDFDFYSYMQDFTGADRHSVKVMCILLHYIYKGELCGRE